MPRTFCRPIASASIVLALAVSAARADTIVEQNVEQRFQLDFHVPDAALKKMLPEGWEPVIAAAGPAKDANLRMIFIDRVAILGADGKPRGSTQMVYLAIPVKQTASGTAGQMIIAGLTKDAADAPGAFGVYQPASTAKMARSQTASGGAAIVEEDWEFAAGSGEHMQVHVKYERAPAAKGGGEVRFFNPSDPRRYQTFETEQGIDITRNATTNPPDRVKEFSLKAGGGSYAKLFDGKEKLLSWDNILWVTRSISLP